MNAHMLAQRAYSNSASSTRTARSTEYEIIAKVTHRIRATALKGSAGFAELASALHDNRKLWTALAVDVAGDGNQLPPPLRAQIVYLAEFTQRHTGEVLKGNAGVAPLLQINAAILKGLSNGGAQR